MMAVALGAGLAGGSAPAVVTIGLVTVAAASRSSPRSSRRRAHARLLHFVIMALGMALTMAPATESIMGSLPRDKAGVGSAVNDTTRQVGGALGVAIIGSVYSSVYNTYMAMGESPLPDLCGLRGCSAAGLGGGGVAGAAPRMRTRREDFPGLADYFPSGTGVLVGAVIALAGALVALLFLPARAPETADEGIDPSEPNAFGLTDGEDIDDLVGAGIAAGVGVGLGAGTRPADGVALAEA
jgi:hypothetical protein